jgi:polysaccharide chain length determinant protein (PEP-CTERM system associated)
MQELIEQVLDYLKGIWIKRRYIMISTWLICPIAWLYVIQLDSIYQSKARVYADTQSILGPLLRGLTIQTNPETQIRLMVKTLLSRPNLERITRMTDLDVQANTPDEYESLIKQLTKGIKINKVGRGLGENIYTIAFKHTNPEMARDVVQSALTVFIENTLGENRSDSNSAHKFLDTQIKEYENRLLAAEQRLAEYKQKYSGTLSGNVGGYYSKLTLEKNKLYEAELQLQEAKIRLASANAQMLGEEPVFGLFSHEIKTENSASTIYDSRIRQLEESLDGLSMRFTDNHPDVKEVIIRLDKLKKQRSADIDKYYKSSSNGKTQALIDKNPVYQELKIQANTFKSEVASLTVRVNNFKAKLKELENKIYTIPEIEAELVALNRGYSMNKNKYEQLLSRKDTANLAQQADESTSKIQFKVIDPPRVPSTPTGPNHLLFLAGVTILGIGVGVALSLLMSQIKPVVTSGSQISRATGIPIFGVVAATENLGLQQWHRRKTMVFILSNSLLFMLFACFVAYALFPSAIKDSIKGIL